MNQQAIFDLIVKHSREVVPNISEHTFQWDDQLKELGANSMDRAEIVMMTLESLALKIPLVRTTQAGNLGELAELLHAELQSQ